MRLLVNDYVQHSNAPDELKTPALADKWVGTSLSIVFSGELEFDCVGVGNTDATELYINGQTVVLDTGADKNGLYVLELFSALSVSFSHNGSFVGRLGLGKSRFLGVAPAREPGFWSTQNSRVTLSGQVVPGAGGVDGRRIDVDVRYKVDREIFADIQSAYRCQIARGFPFFINFDKEYHRFPWKRLYAETDKELLFQSSVNRFLYSKRFSFEERY